MQYCVPFESTLVDILPIQQSQLCQDPRTETSVVYLMYDKTTLLLAARRSYTYGEFVLHE